MVKTGGCSKNDNQSGGARRRKTKKHIKRRAKKGGSLFGASMKALGSALVPLAFFQSARTYSRNIARKRSFSKTRRRRSTYRRKR